MLGLLLLPPLLGPAEAQSLEVSARVGLAELRSGLWCLATAATPAEGAELLLYEPYQGVRAAARVKGPAEAECGELKSRFLWPRRPDAPMHLYRIEPTDPEGVGPVIGAGALFALLAPADAVAGRGIDLDGDGAPERFRICASQEGLHFLVESGERVAWHAYDHLGLEVEPDCPDRIYAE